MRPSGLATSGDVTMSDWTSAMSDFKIRAIATNDESSMSSVNVSSESESEEETTTATDATHTATHMPRRRPLVRILTVPLMLRLHRPMLILLPVHILPLLQRIRRCMQPIRLRLMQPILRLLLLRIPRPPPIRRPPAPLPTRMLTLRMQLRHTHPLAHRRRQRMARATLHPQAPTRRLQPLRPLLTRPMHIRRLSSRTGKAIVNAAAVHCVRVPSRQLRSDSLDRNRARTRSFELEAGDQRVAIVGEH